MPRKIRRRARRLFSRGVEHGDTSISDRPEERPIPQTQTQDVATSSGIQTKKKKEK